MIKMKADQNYFLYGMAQSDDCEQSKRRLASKLTESDFLLPN